MPLQLTAGNIRNFIAMTGPTMLTGSLLMLSVIDKNLKGLLYIVGLALTMLFAWGWSSNTEVPGAPLPCALWTLGSAVAPISTSISMSTCYYLYTVAYFIVPMVTSGVWNPATIVLLVLLQVMDAVYIWQYNCCSLQAAMLSVVIGAFLGAAWALVLGAFGLGDQLYFSSNSSAVVCSKPAKQSFRCKTTSSPTKPPST